MKAQFVTRLFHCPTCDHLYYLPVLPLRRYEGTERICGRCWRRDMKESDIDSDPRSA